MGGICTYCFNYNINCLSRIRIVQKNLESLDRMIRVAIERERIHKDRSQSGFRSRE